MWRMSGDGLRVCSRWRNERLRIKDEGKLEAMTNFLMEQKDGC